MRLTSSRLYYNILVEKFGFDGQKMKIEKVCFWIFGEHAAIIDKNGIQLALNHLECVLKYFWLALINLCFSFCQNNCTAFT